MAAFRAADEVIVKALVARSTSTPRAAVLAGAAIALSVAALVGTGVALDGPRSFVVLPLIAATGLALAALWWTRFELFVLAALVLRPLADWSKAPGVGSGLAASALAGGLMAGGVVWYVAQRSAGDRTSLTDVAKASLVLIAAGGFSAAASSQPLTSFAEAARMAGGLAMIVVLDQLVVRGLPPRRIVTACYAAAVVPLALAVVQMLAGGASGGAGANRVTGTFLHPNSFAIFLALLIVMGAALFRHLAGRARIAIAIMLAGCSVSLLFTYSRGGWITVGVGLLVVGLCQSRGLLLLLPIGALIVVLAVPSVTARLADLEAQQTYAAMPGNSFAWRVDYWSETLDLVEGQTLTGIGLKMTQLSEGMTRAPHNDFVRMYVEAGIVGLAAYVTWLWVLGRRAYRALMGATAGFERGLAVGFAGCFAAFLANSLGANLISQIVVLWYFLALAAVPLPSLLSSERHALTR